MWTSQVYGHHEKMARTKNTEHHKTRSIQRRNKQEKNIFLCFTETSNVYVRLCNLIIKTSFTFTLNQK